MKTSAALILAIAGIALASPQPNPAMKKPSSTSVALTPQETCAIKCGPSNPDCEAACFGAAHPDVPDVMATTKCVKKCPKGNGSAQDTQIYAECVQSCIGEHYPTTGTAMPAPVAASTAGGAAPGGQHTGAVPVPTGSSSGGSSMGGSSMGGSGSSMGGTGTGTGTGAGNSNGGSSMGGSGSSGSSGNSSPSGTSSGTSSATSSSAASAGYVAAPFTGFAAMVMAFFAL